jgi:hypothetical protein
MVWKVAVGIPLGMILGFFLAVFGGALFVDLWDALKSFFVKLKRGVK